MKILSKVPKLIKVMRMKKKTDKHVRLQPYETAVLAWSGELSNVEPCDRLWILVSASLGAAMDNGLELEIGDPSPNSSRKQPIFKARFTVYKTCGPLEVEGYVWSLCI